MSRRTVTHSHLSKFLLLTFMGLLVISSATPTRAFTQAFFHTQSTGNRGNDVRVLQYLLNLTADGVFGSGTATAVRNFQTSKGLAADGVAGPATWSALVPTIRLGSSGNAVRALQIQLNEKSRAGLPVDGVFGGGTETAVKNFQSHAGLTPDGVVGPTTWKNLIWHYDYPNFSTTMCNQDPDGNGLADWGTAATIGQLEAAAATFAATGQGKVPVGDVSFEHGGIINGHNTHRVGMDVDIWPIRTDNGQCTAGRITWQSSTYDRAATRQLIQAIRNAAPGHIKVIYWNDQTLINEGLSVSFPNHDNHIHVRYCENYHPDPEYDC